MFNDMFTWDFIGSFVVMVASVSLITQLIKQAFDQFFGKIRTEKLVYLVSLVTVAVVVVVTEDFQVIKWQDIIRIVFTGLIDSVLVALTAMKSYENIFCKIPELFREER